MNYLTNNNDYLMHYGVKGMKWGVRNNPESVYNRTKNIAKYGWAQGHGINVNNRLQRIKNDPRRRALMSKRQKWSLDSASRYWSNRAKGKGIHESGNRGFIRREADSFRSLSFKRRAGIAAVQNLNNTIVNNQRAGGVMNAGQIAANSSLGAAGQLGVDELLNRAFGHF